MVAISAIYGMKVTIRSFYGMMVTIRFYGSAVLGDGLSTVLEGWCQSCGSGSALDKANTSTVITA